MMPKIQGEVSYFKDEILFCLSRMFHVDSQRCFRCRTIPNSVFKIKSERRKVFVGDQIDECKDYSGLFYVLPFQKVQIDYLVKIQDQIMYLTYGASWKTWVNSYLHVTMRTDYSQQIHLPLIVACLGSTAEVLFQTSQKFY